MSGPVPVELAYREHGTQTPAALILHGLFGSSSNWRSLARRIGERRRVVLPDARNHGLSPHAATMTYPAQAADVARLLERLALDAVHLVGHSMGGKTAMHFAGQHPGQVRSLAVLDVAPVAYASAAQGDEEPGHAALIEGMRALPLDRIESRGDADRALAARVPDAALRAFLLQSLERGDGGKGWRWRLNLAVLARSLADLRGFPPPPSSNPPYEGPVLFLIGGRSRYVRSKHHRAIRSLFPHARLEVIEDAGHWLHAEQPNRIATRLEHWFDETS